MKKIKHFLNSKINIFLLTLFILELVLSIFITPNLYDDAWFIKQITNEMNDETGEIIEHTIPDFVQNRYYTWSSRVIIEFVFDKNNAYCESSAVSNNKIIYKTNFQNLEKFKNNVLGRIFYFKNLY